MNIDLDVMTNKCHFEIEMTAVQRFETTFDLRRLLTNGQQVDVIETPAYKSFDKAQNIAPLSARTLVKSVQNNICVLERLAQFFEDRQQDFWHWLLHSILILRIQTLQSRGNA